MAADRGVERGPWRRGGKSGGSSSSAPPPRSRSREEPAERPRERPGELLAEDARPGLRVLVGHAAHGMDAEADHLLRAAEVLGR